MKKIYFAPQTKVASCTMQTILHTISNSSLDGGSSNGGTTATGTTGPRFEDGEQELTPDGFAKHRGFYSGYEDF